MSICSHIPDTSLLLCNPARGVASLQKPFSASCLFTASDLLVGGCRPSHRDAGKHHVFSVCVHFTTLFHASPCPSLSSLSLSSSPCSLAVIALSSRLLFYSATRRLLVDFTPLKPVICSPTLSAICTPLHELTRS